MVNDELECIWKEEIMAYFKVLYQHLFERTDATRVKSQLTNLTSEPRFKPRWVMTNTFQ